MNVIGFFRNVFDTIPQLIAYISTPLGELLSVDIPFINELSIIQLLGVSLVGFLGVMLSIHVIRLFIGG